MPLTDQYADGMSGLLTLTYKAGVDADATFDNYMAKAGSTDAPSLDLGPAPGMLFGNAVHYPVGKSPWGPAIGDFNGDGKPDLINVNNQSKSVSLLVGNGDGTFQAKKDTAVGAGPQFVASGDLNGDQKLDAVVSNSTDNTASVLLGNGDGTFQAKVDYPVGTKPVAIALADLNHDRILDMVTMNLGSSVAGDSTLSVLLGKGDGTFQAAVNYPAGDGDDTVRIEDLNQDTHPDLLTREGSNIWVLLGKGDGTFQSESKTPLPGVLWDFATGDFNADGKVDVAATSSAQNAIYILLGQGDGAFAAPRTFSVPGPTFVYTADLDGDGALDLIVRGNSGSLADRGRASQQITVLRGLGDGRFQPPGTVIRCGGYPGPMVIGDLNGDHRPDLVSMSSNNFLASVFLNQGPALGAAGRLEFSWPTTTPGFVLEGGAEVGGPWTAVQTAPRIGHGPANTVELDKGGELQFFRLRKAP